MISVGLTTKFNSYAQLYDDSTGLNQSGIDDPDVQAPSPP